MLLLVVRGLPSLLVYRRTLPRRQRIEMTFITATTMPLLIALAEIGLSDGVMIPANAAALVGAGVLSVLVYPAIAVALARRGRAALARPARQRSGSAWPATAGSWGPPAQPGNPASRAKPTPRTTSAPPPPSRTPRRRACRRAAVGSGRGLRARSATGFRAGRER